jgi:hypothetical protein
MEINMKMNDFWLNIKGEKREKVDKSKAKKPKKNASEDV